MIDGLETLLAGEPHLGMDELRALVLEVLGGRRVEGRAGHAECLSRKRVYRVHFEIGAGTRSLIVKCLPLGRSERERLASQQWLPRLGLAEYAPPLLGVAVDRHGAIAWHVYEDLGPHALVGAMSDPQRVAAAIDAIARVHVRFSQHAILAECRLAGGGLGAHFFEASLRDAQRNVERMLRAPNVGERGRAVAAQLRTRLQRVVGEQPERSRLLLDRGGPETLLHGDLWTRNILTIPRPPGFHVRLIDWDHCGVGPVVYDLAAFLRRFPIQERRRLLEAYRGHVASMAWVWPTVAELNDMFDTAELARFANSITWRVVAIAQADPAPAPEWAIEDLEGIDGWFDNLCAVLPVDDARGADADRRAV